MTFGEKLTGLRKREGLSQEALAEQLGVSRQAVSRWEQGAALPDAAKLLPCARLFSVDVEWLLDEEQDGEDRLSAAEFLQGTERPLFTETGPGISPAASSPARVLWVW